MPSFLLRYHRRTGELEVTEFTGARARSDALSARLSAEAERTDPDVEINSLSADSLEDLKHTHGRYFHSPSELIRNALGKPSH
jgi:hypothetical protein